MQAVKTEPLRGLVAELYEVNQQMKGLERQQDRLKTQIHKELGDSAERIKLELGEYSVTRTTVAQERVDGRTLKQLHPEIYSQLTYTTVSKRLVVERLSAPVEAANAAPAVVAAPVATPPAPAGGGRRRRRR